MHRATFLVGTSSPDTATPPSIPSRIYWQHILHRSLPCSVMHQTDDSIHVGYRSASTWLIPPLRLQARHPRNELWSPSHTLGKTSWSMTTDESSCKIDVIAMHRLPSKLRHTEVFPIPAFHPWRRNDRTYTRYIKLRKVYPPHVHWPVRCGRSLWISRRISRNDCWCRTKILLLLQFHALHDRLKILEGLGVLHIHCLKRLLQPL